MASVVVGLGNPGPEYSATRHNVGHRVLDRLARRLHGRWRREGRAFVASVEWQGEPLTLAKPIAYMNVSGPVVAQVLRELKATPADLVLVYDDIDLTLGTVRIRLRGSHGGHNGVRSVIETLGTQEIRRVKVGVGRPASKAAVADHVLSGFDRDELPVVEAAVEEAVERVLGLAGSPPPPAAAARDPGGAFG